MDNQTSWVKMSSLVKKQFIFKTIMGKKYKKWNDAEKTFEIKDTYFEGSQLKVQVQTDQGTLDMSWGQICQILGACFDHATLSSKIQNAIIEVGSNGKAGIDIRYYFKKKGYANDISKEEEINIEDIPFDN